MELHSNRIRYLRLRLVPWFRVHGRSYPWRLTKDPWRVLIAEMMLQRTRADQVERVYTLLFQRYKTPLDVAGAPMSRLKSILLPLGLAWRIPKFKQVASAIVNSYRGRVPSTRDEIKQLPGVGDYVAGAVLSIGYGKREWIVDSNVVRVYQRFLGLKTSKEGRRDRSVIEFARHYVRYGDPRRANLGLLDFAALVCKPAHPHCDICPVRKKCIYHLKTRSSSARGNSPIVPSMI